MCVLIIPTVKLLQKSRSSGSTESAEKILQSLSGQISEKMKSYTASRPTWEEKNAQIASRLQNSILTQNLSVKSAQNFMDKFVHKQGTKNGPSPASLIEPSSYYAASISPETAELDDSDNAVVTSGTVDSTEVQSTSGITTAKTTVKTKVVGKVIASPISSGSGGAMAATKIPRGVVTATPVTTQTTPATSQQQQQQQSQQGAINPTAISLANALKALAAAQSRAQQQQLQKKSSNSSAATTAAIAAATSTTGVNKEPTTAVPTAVTTAIPVNSANKMVSVTVNEARSVQEDFKSKTKSEEPTSPQEVAQTSVTTPTQPASSSSSVQEPADSTQNESGKPQVSLNAILGTNLSPEAERLLSALITSLQPSQVSSSSTTGQAVVVTVPSAVSVVAQSLPTTSAISSGALSFCSTVSSEQSQGAPQYAPFPSSGTRTATEQLVVNNADDHFISHEEETSQLLQTTTALVDDGPLSESTDLGALCDLGSFTSSSDNKRPLELSDSLFTGSSIKRPHMDTAEF